MGGIWVPEKTAMIFPTFQCTPLFLQHEETVNSGGEFVAPYPHLKGNLVQLCAGAVAAAAMPRQGGLAQGRAGQQLLALVIARRRCRRRCSCRPCCPGAAAAAGAVDRKMSRGERGGQGGQIIMEVSRISAYYFWAILSLWRYKNVHPIKEILPIRKNTAAVEGDLLRGRSAYKVLRTLLYRSHDSIANERHKDGVWQPLTPGIPLHTAGCEKKATLVGACRVMMSRASFALRPVTQLI